MLHTIHNAYLTVSVSERGAELQSIRTAAGTEVLWQGDAAYWGDRALNIFPYVARLWQGQYHMDEEIYQMPIHGFAPTSCFALTEIADTHMVFELRDSEETYAQYPRHFVYRVIYTLKEHELAVTYEVHNLDDKAMYFGLGGHPGFNVPLEEGKRFEDYSLCFDEACKPVRVGFTEDCFVSGEDTPFVLRGDTELPLHHDLFDEDAIVLRDTARSVTLKACDGKRRVKVSFPDMPYLGIWHWPKTDAPYVCIEPWSSLPARAGKVAVFEEQEDLICLQAGGRYANTWTIVVYETECIEKNAE